MATKRCAHCSKDIPQTSSHCVFCGQKQPEGGAGAMAEKKTIMGYSVADLMPRPGAGPGQPGMPQQGMPPQGQPFGQQPPQGQPFGQPQQPQYGQPPQGQPFGQQPMGSPPPGLGAGSEARTVFAAPAPVLPQQPQYNQPPQGQPFGQPQGGPPPGQFGGPPQGQPQFGGAGAPGQFGGPPQGGMPNMPSGPQGMPGGFPSNPQMPQMGGFPQQPQMPQMPNMGQPMGGMPMMGGFPQQPQMPQGMQGGMPQMPQGMQGGMPQAPQMPNVGGQIAGGMAKGIGKGMMGGMMGGMGGMMKGRGGGTATADGSSSEHNWDHHLKTWCFIFGGLGVLWFSLQILLGDADNPVDNLKMIFHLPGMLKLFFLAVPATGIVMALVGWLPVPKEVRGAAMAGSGLLLIILLLLQPGGEGGAQAMLGGGFLRYLMLVGFVATGAGLWVRGHAGEEGNMIGKIMSAGGGALILAAFLIPVHSMMGIQAAFKMFSFPAMELKLLGFMMVLLFALGAVSVASFFVPAIGNLSKFISYGVTFWWGATIALMTALDVFGSHPSIRCIGSGSGCMKAKLRYCVQQAAPSIICIGAAVFGLAFLVHKFAGQQQQQQA